MLLSLFHFSCGHKSNGDPLANSTSHKFAAFSFSSFFLGRRVLGVEGRKECLTKDVILCFVEYDLLLH